MEKIINGTRVTILEDKEAISTLVAVMIIVRVTANPQEITNILVPTGTTPEILYNIFSEHMGKLSSTRFFNMDEYVVQNTDGTFIFLDPHNETSYHYYMKKKLFKSDFSPENHFPGIENIDHPGSYDAIIDGFGSLDIAINAMGEDGHTFGFNSPPEARFDSVTRLVTLPEDTKMVNASLTGRATPSHAMTIGLATGMQAKEIFFLVSGKRKAEILKKTLEGEISESVPATVLRTHPNCHWIVDEDAASLFA